MGTKAVFYNDAMLARLLDHQVNRPKGRGTKPRGLRNLYLKEKDAMAAQPPDTLRPNILICKERKMIMKKYKKTMKRSLTLLLAFALCLSMSQITAFASSNLNPEDTDPIVTDVDSDVNDSTGDGLKITDSVSESVAGETEEVSASTDEMVTDEPESDPDVIIDECPVCHKTGGEHSGTCSQNPANVKCSECGESGGSHTGTCSQNSANVKCSECGESGGNHTGTCSQNPANVKCSECGESGGNHTGTCSQNPANVKCSECGESGGNHIGTCSQNSANKACEECGKVGEHSGTCSKNDINQKPEGPSEPETPVETESATEPETPVIPEETEKPDESDAPYSFNVTVGDGESNKGTITELTKDNVMEAIPEVITGNDGQQYVLDEVTGGNWTWYRPGTSYGVDKFYNQTMNEASSNELPQNLKNGIIQVSYAVDANGDGIADKYQAVIEYKNGNGEIQSQLVKNLGFALSENVVPGYSRGPFYTEQGNASLEAVEPATLEGKEFSNWTVKCGEEVVYTIEEFEESGRRFVVVMDVNGVMCSAPQLLYENVNPLSLIALNLQGGKTYTVEANFKDITTDPTETETDPTETETDPTETETDPTETETDPTETETDPTETETDPTETETDPTETETDPAETETDPVETESNPAETDPVEPETPAPGTTDPVTPNPGPAEPETPATPVVADVPATQANIPAETPVEVAIPDEAVPLTVNTGEMIIADEEVPLAGVPADVIILDDDVPLANVPQTGDISVMWYFIMILSAAGLLIVNRKEVR